MINGGFSIAACVKQASEVGRQIVGGLMLGRSHT
jgi:hypothetical protein